MILFRLFQFVIRRTGYLFKHSYIFIPKHKIGKRTKINATAWFSNPKNIEIGADSKIGAYNFFHIKKGQIKIGNNVLIGAHVSLITENHDYSKLQMEKEHLPGSIVIEDNVWIGDKVIILPNVTIAEGAIVGAGSVVTKDLPRYMIAVGVPAKPIKQRNIA